MKRKMKANVTRVNTRRESPLLESPIFYRAFGDGGDGVVVVVLR